MEFCLPMLVSNARSVDQSCPIPNKPASHRTHRVQLYFRNYLVFICICFSIYFSAQLQLLQGIKRNPECYPLHTNVVVYKPARSFKQTCSTVGLKLIDLDFPQPNSTDKKRTKLPKSGLHIFPIGAHVCGG
jgi:hypothetical protein